MAKKTKIERSFVFDPAVQDIAEVMASLTQALRPDIDIGQTFELIAEMLSLEEITDETIEFYGSLIDATTLGGDMPPTKDMH